MKKRFDRKKSAIEILQEEYRGNRKDLDTRKLNACDVLIEEAQSTLENCAKIYIQLEIQENRLKDELTNLGGLKTGIDKIMDEGYASNLWNAVVASILPQKDYRKMIKRIGGGAKTSDRAATFMAFGLSSSHDGPDGSSNKQAIWAAAEQILKEKGPMHTETLTFEIKRLRGRPITPATVTQSLHRQPRLFFYDLNTKTWRLIDG